MKLLICVDDTDDLTKEISTGKIAGYIKKEIKNRGIGKCREITRHQLLIHKDVKYTSHNSSMCFEVVSEIEYYNEIKEIGIEIINKYKSKISDPGLCIVNVEKLLNKEKLIDYSLRCKKEVIKKEEAYNIANELGIDLTEHGGDGQGIVGALAGCGLRLSGNDGEYKGSIAIDGQTINVEQLKKEYKIDKVCTLNGKELENNQEILLKGKNKCILRDFKKVFLVKDLKLGNNKYVACSKDLTRWIHENKNAIDKYEQVSSKCNNFEMDVEEELIVDGKNCVNCVYRRWMDNTIECMFNK